MRLKKFSSATSALLIVAALGAQQAYAASNDKMSFNIPAQSLKKALFDFSQQTHIVVLLSEAEIDNLQSNALSGTYAPEDALHTLLENSGVSYQYNPADSTLTINGPSDTGARDGSSQSDSDNKNQLLDKKKQVIEEMVVTATKRETRLQDTAMSITAIGQEQIEVQGLTGAEDFLRAVPGVAYAEIVPGLSQITIRGLRTQAFEPSTVGSYLGSIPTTFTTALTRGRSDIKLVDIERVEILRGPQGTLYGAGAMGGVVRTIPNSPNLSQFEGSFKMGLAGNAESDDLSNSQVGVINLPLVEDSLALRVAAYRFDNAGYRDYVSTPEAELEAQQYGYTLRIEKDTDYVLQQGGRATLLWQATENLSAELVLGVQDVEGGVGLGGFDSTQPGYVATTLDGFYQQIDQKQSYNHINVEYDFGWSSLTSTFTWTNNKYSESFAGSPVNVYIDTTAIDTDVFSHETRLTTSFTGPLQFVAGVYYEEMTQDLNVGGVVALRNQPPWDQIARDDPRRRYLSLTHAEDLERLALFGEVEYAFTEQWSLTLGARWFQYDRKDDFWVGENDYIWSPPDFIPAKPTSLLNADENGTNFKGNLTYKPNDDIMLYATWAEGFRLGYGKALPTQPCDVNNDGILDGTDVALSTQVDSDSTTNYEIGAKLSLLDRRLSVNTAIYRIDWDNLPVTVYGNTDVCTAGVTANAGSAMVQGAELESQFFVTSQLMLTAGVAYNDSELLDDYIGTVGQRLPVAARVNGNLGAQYDFVWAGRTGFLRADYNFATGAYSSVLRRFPESDDYGQWNLRAGMDFENISVAVYGRNLTGEDAIIGYFNGTERAAAKLMPRTYGLDLTYNF